MEHYWLLARSITHVQQMDHLMRQAGIRTEIRRAGNSVTEHGCGYLLEIKADSYEKAMKVLRGTPYRPQKIFRVVNGERFEVNA